MPENIEITVTGEPAADDVAAVRAGVVARNVEVARAEPAKPLAVLGRQDGAVVAGPPGSPNRAGCTCSTSGWPATSGALASDKRS